MPGDVVMPREVITLTLQLHIHQEDAWSGDIFTSRTFVLTLLSPISIFK